MCGPLQLREPAPRLVTHMLEGAPVYRRTELGAIYLGQGGAGFKG